MFTNMIVDVYSILLILFILALCLLIVLSAVLFLTTSRHPVIVRYEEEFYFRDPTSLTKKHKFPELKEPASLTLSVIVPAYNEETRLQPMLDECLEYLEGRQKADKSFTYEVIVVDDGSSDRTTDVAWKYSARFGVEKVRVLTLVKNRGKGGAVRLGMLSARGKWLLFADADGATHFPDFSKLESVMQGLEDCSRFVVVVGSRAHLEKESIAQRSVFRTFLMKAFHMLVWVLAVRGVKDTQCGFKLISRPAARVLFPSLHVERWAFDVEMLYMAQALKFMIGEVAVQWTEIEGSKVVPFWSWLEMGRDLVLIWYRYTIGAWTIAVKPDLNAVS